MPRSLFWVALIGAPFLLGSATGNGGVTLLAIAAVLIANPIVWKVRKDRYFGSEEFRNLRSEVEGVIREHNDVVNYLADIRSQGTFELGSSATGQYAHLASFENTSAWNNSRDRNVAEYAPHVHNASLQVVRNASTDPIKYLMKYFSIKADKDTLSDVQRVADSIARLEEAVANVQQREAAIAATFSPPKFILTRYAAEFWRQVGVQLSPVHVPYPQYKFQYTSAGGNSGQTTTIDLNTPTLEALSATLVDKIRWAKSAAGQRALMTNRLRTEIKTRDDFTCLTCGISVQAEPHLLLEVDHITPVSKGGISSPENLQTLCWRCNRSKGAKIVTAPSDAPPA
ncbi:MAG: HNH endonuclease [Actinobacteria bacterium HGW-Actinobacteria-4]|nr:MAG: HNH endonuclease [Actinobacteria bacterium HGW-Actinobacteria-4]